jgi:hypothetical protein
MSLLDLAALPSFIVTWVISVMCKFETNMYVQNELRNLLGCWFLGCLMAPSNAELQQ